MKVLLSIKPEYAEKIFSGEKKYEYRRKLFRRSGVSSIVIYVTQPVGLIIGEFEIADVIEGVPEELWEGTKDYSGISKKFFIKYFGGSKRGYAIKVGNVKKYRESIDPYAFQPNFVPPQSYRYLKDQGLFDFDSLSQAVN